MAEFRHMIRIANTDLPGQKPLGYALCKIKGVSYAYAHAICTISGVSKAKKTGDLTEREIEQLRQVIEKECKVIPPWMRNRRKDYETGEDMHILGPNLNFVRETDIRRLKKIKAYRGLRHSFGLPVRGQRTRSNFRKSKGNAIGVKRSKEAPAKKD